MKSFFAAARMMLTKKEPAAQLAEIRERIRTATAEAQRLDTEVSRRALAITTGDPEAARVADDCKAEKVRVLDELVTLRHAEGQLASEIAQKEAAERRAVFEALPAQLAADHVEMLRLDDEIEQDFANVSEKVKRRHELGEAVARRSGSAALHRVNNGFNLRLKASVARYFATNDGGPRLLAANILGITGDFVGEIANRTLRQHDEPLLDEALPYFSSEDAALAAQTRQQERGTATIISRIGQAWTLTRHDQLFADRAAAQNYVLGQARIGRDLVILPKAPGFLVVDKAVAETIEALSDAAD